MRKSEKKKREEEKFDQINAGGISPLMFHFFQISDSLSQLTGNIRGFIEVYEQANKIGKLKEFEKDLIDFLIQEIDRLETDAVKEVLLNRIGFIKPSSFRQQLFLFFPLLQLYKRKVIEFTKEGFSDDFLEQDIKFLKNVDIAGTLLMNAANRFTSSFDIWIHKGEKGLINTVVFPQEQFKTISKLLNSKNAIIVQDLTQK